MECLESFKPDLLILDIGLSGADAREICKEIKSVNAHVKIIFISAMPNLMEEYKRCNADTAISKPFALDEDLENIELLMKEGKKFCFFLFYLAGPK